jgi:tRNA(fMet)-specific endonuclease VapC
MNKAVLDTDTLSAIMRQNPAVIVHAQAYLVTHSQLTISIVTRYEILRGLNAKNATAQLAAFDALCQSIAVLPITDAIIVRSAEIYGRLHQAGQLVGDAGILIAATCLEHDSELITNNTSHFSRIPGLVVGNWLAQKMP